MCHLTVVNQPKSHVRGVLEYLREHELENIIALAGDPPKGSAELDWTPHPDGYHHSRELVEDALAFDDGWFSIAVAGFPEVHPRAIDRASDLRYLKERSTPAPTWSSRSCSMTTTTSSASPTTCARSASTCRSSRA